MVRMIRLIENVFHWQHTLQGMMSSEGMYEKQLCWVWTSTNMS